VNLVAALEWGDSEVRRALRLPGQNRTYVSE